MSHFNDILRVASLILITTWGTFHLIIWRQGKGKSLSQQAGGALSLTVINRPKLGRLVYKFVALSLFLAILAQLPTHSQSLSLFSRPRSSRHRWQLLLSEVSSATDPTSCLAAANLSAFSLSFFLSLRSPTASAFWSNLFLPMSLSPPPRYRPSFTFCTESKQSYSYIAVLAPVTSSTR